MKAKIKMLEKLKKIMSSSQRVKNRFALFSLTGLLLILMMVIPDTGFSVPSPLHMIVNDDLRECAELHLGYKLTARDCEPPEGWRYAEYGFADYVCPEGYVNTREQYEPVACMEPGGDGPRRKPPGFGCFW